MICQRCLQRLGQPRSFSRHAISSSSTSARNFSRATSRAAQAVSAQTATATNPRPNDLAAATSTSAAQPFSAPLVSGARQSDLGPAEQQPPKVVSSCPAGTPLKGLNFKKNAQDPLALEDEAYPAWLWRVLDKKAGADDVVGGEGDMFSKSKKQRRIAAKALRKQQLLNPGLLEPKIPLYEQTIDLPAGDGSLQGSKDAIAARTELTKAMRDKRRSKIKEDNFLKEMR